MRSTVSKVWFGVSLLMFLATAAFADTKGYGVVESYGEGKIAIHLADGSTGTWSVDKATAVTGAVEVGDWVFANVEASGHVKTLKLEERATKRGGVIKSIKGIVLTIHSGSFVESWNVTPSTVLVGVDKDALQAGDELAFSTYKNRNIATLKVVKTGVKVN
jgi:hypothetical protein